MENKKKIFPKKRVILVTALIFSLAVIMAGATYAYFTGKNSVVNDFRGANLEAVVSEEYTTPTSPVEVGTEYNKKVTVINTSNQSEFIRVMAFPQITYTDNGDTVVLDAADYVTYDLNTTDWVDGEDGYYYYKSSLKPGQTTSVLFTKVTVSYTVAANYDGASFDISVKSEASVISKSNSYRTAYWSGTTPTAGALKTVDDLWQVVIGSEAAD